MTLRLDALERDAARAIVGTATLARAHPLLDVRALAEEVIEPFAYLRTPPTVTAAGAKILLLLLHGIETQYRVSGDRILERVGAAVAASEYAAEEDADG